MAAGIPATRRTWQIVRRGSPAAALELISDAPVPKLAQGDVLVKIQAAALNPVGWKLMELLPHFIRKKQHIAEHDLSGVVVDANNTSFSVGDPVFGFIDVALNIKSGEGALSEYARVPADHLALRPSTITPTGATLVLAAMTAYQALFDIAKLEPEQHVFINGGSSSVGAFAIQLAKARNCKVAVSASGKNEEFVRSLGADEFFDYTTGPLQVALSVNPPSPKFHVILDAVALLDPSLYTHSPAYLAPDGIYISTGPMPKGLSFSEAKTTGRMILEVFLKPRWLGGTKRKWKLVSLKHKKEDLDDIAKLISEGKLKPVIDSVYSFEDAKQAYEHILTGRAKGKVVVKVDPEAE